MIYEKTYKKGYSWIIPLHQNVKITGERLKESSHCPFVIMQFTFSKFPIHTVMCVIWLFIYMM